MCSVCPAAGAWIDLSPYLDRSPTLIFDTTPFDRGIYIPMLCMLAPFPMSCCADFEEH